MEWILLMQIVAATVCDSLIVPEAHCEDYVLECTLDGESPEWCLNDYLEER